MKEKEENTKRKGFAEAQTVSHPEQQARPSQGGVGVKIQQAQGQNMVDRAELEMGDDPHLGTSLTMVSAQDPE